MYVLVSVPVRKPIMACVLVFFVFWFLSVLLVLLQEPCSYESFSYVGAQSKGRCFGILYEPLTHGQPPI